MEIRILLARSLVDLSNATNFIFTGFCVKTKHRRRIAKTSSVKTKSRISFWQTCFITQPNADVVTNVLRLVIRAKNKSSRPRKARNVDKQNKRHKISFLDRQALVAVLADQSVYL